MLSLPIQVWFEYICQARPQFWGRHMALHAITSVWCRSVLLRQFYTVSFCQCYAAFEITWYFVVYTVVCGHLHSTPIKEGVFDIKLTVKSMQTASLVCIWINHVNILILWRQTDGSALPCTGIPDHAQQAYNLRELDTSRDSSKYCQVSARK